MSDPYSPEFHPRRVKPLIFVVDTSGSMGGAKITSFNTAVREALNDVGEISKTNTDAQIKIGVLVFSNGASWMCDKLIEAETFQWQDLSASTKMFWLILPATLNLLLRCMMLTS